MPAKKRSTRTPSTKRDRSSKPPARSTAGIAGKPTGNRTAEPAHASGAAQSKASSRKLASGLINQNQARRLAMRSEREAARGVADLEEGAVLAALSADMGRLSDAARALSLESVQRGMELAAMAGQIGTVGDALAATGMESLGTFLNETSRRMRDIAVRDMLQAEDTQGLAQAIGIAGAGVGGIGEQEVATAAAELSNAESATDASRLVAAVADDQIAAGLTEAAAPKTKTG